MAKPKSVTKCKSQDEFVRAVKSQGGTIGNGGRHTYADTDNGRIPLGHSNGDLPTGTRFAIIKALLAAGFVGLVIVFGKTMLVAVGTAAMIQ